MPLVGISHLECFTAKNLFREHAHTLDIVPELTLKTLIISLIDCCIPKTELGYILNACRCLKSFTYVVRHREESYRDPFVLEPVTLMEMLNIQKHNLTKLHISFPCEVHIFKYVSFAGYPNLQYLRIEQGYLLKLQKFPESLETLFFFWMTAYIQLVHYAVRESHQFMPNLKQASIHPRRSPCMTILGIWPPLNQEDCDINTSIQADFQKGVCELEGIASSGSFEFYVDSEIYQSCRENC